MNERRNLFWVTFLSGVVCVSGGLALRGQAAQSLDGSVILVAIGTSVIAAVLFALVYQSKLDQYVTRQLRTDIRLAITDELQIQQAQSAASASELSPLRSFPASESPISSYNALYNDAFARTTSLSYSGDKALYLTFRLGQRASTKNPALSVDVLLPNPTQTSLFRMRAEHLSNGVKYKGQPIDQIAESLKKDLLAALVAFHDLRNSYSFSIAFTNELPFLRYELLDEILVLSLLPMQQYGYYPPTLVYSRQSLFYSTFATHFRQLKDLAGPPPLDNSSISEAVIEAIAAKAGVTTTPTALRAIYESYHNTVAKL